jgi:hypothetical protein
LGLCHNDKGRRDPSRRPSLQKPAGVDFLARPGSSPRPERRGLAPTARTGQGDDERAQVFRDRRHPGPMPPLPAGRGHTLVGLFWGSATTTRGDGIPPAARTGQGDDERAQVFRDRRHPGPGQRRDHAGTRAPATDAASSRRTRSHVGWVILGLCHNDKGRRDPSRPERRGLAPTARTGQGDDERAQVFRDRRHPGPGQRRDPLPAGRGHTLVGLFWGSATTTRGDGIPPAAPRCKNGRGRTTVATSPSPRPDGAGATERAGAG